MPLTLPMRYQKPELSIIARDLPRTTVNFAQPPSEERDRERKSSMHRVAETPVADAFFHVDETNKKVSDA